MYRVILLISCFVCAFAITKEYYDLEDAEWYFNDFMNEYNKDYVDVEEYEYRLKIFKNNLEEANRLNSKSPHAVFGITQFSDLTNEEFLATYTGVLNVTNGIFCDIKKTDADIQNSGAPAAFDWRQKNAVTRVKNQGQCGSCYSFSTSGHVESMYFIAKNQPLSEFSEQQIIDCDTVSKGCQGGYMPAALQAIIRLGGPMYERDYPYQEIQGQCASDPSRVVPGITQCISYDLKNQDKVKELLHQVGPIPIAIAAEALSRYQGGIVYDQQCTGQVNHAVLLVGYGSENGIDYWTVKNSWDTSFGESGYFRLQRSNNPNGACSMMNNLMTTAVLQ